MFILPVQCFRPLNNVYTNRNLHSKKTYLTQPSDSVSFSGKTPKVNVFDNYKPIIKLFDGYELPVHNKEIARKLQASYTSNNFKNLFDYASKKGAFDLNINPKTHFITTSLINAKENPLMGKLIWVTDSCRYMPILKDKYPQAAVPLMENISSYYKKQERNFNKVINNPLDYELNHGWPNTSKYGIGHVFNPNNMKTHKWYTHTRLESPGLYLQTMADLISEGFKGAKYGYKKASDISQNSIDSIANITAYLKKLIYPYSKSTGSWEEQTFMITPSSDVAIINEGFRKIINLMYSPTKNPELIKVRNRLISSKNGKIFEDEKGLKDMLKLGEIRIKQDSISEVPYDNERILDGALSFIPHTEKFSDNPVKDAEEIIKRMEYLETGDNKIPEIVRSHGVIRYSGDNYLNMTSDHIINESVNTGYKTEAQWFMTSDISKSYGTAAKRLLDKIDEEKRVDAKTIELLNKAIQKQTEYINRSYARITGKNTFKANGKECPSFQLPEAYQAVTNSKGEILFVPGTHTPLGWAQSSLYDASKLYLENLNRFEKLNKGLTEQFPNK